MGVSRTYTHIHRAARPCIHSATYILPAVGHTLQLLSATVMVSMLLVLLQVLSLKLLGVNSISPRAARLS